MLQGALLSGAQRQPFDHNDWRGLDDLLIRSRRKFEKVIICVEGIYSMDGDVPPMPEIIEVARKHKALTMVDEAHSFGALGARGYGIGEHFGLKPDDVDIWMGTLSKTLAGCGGYVAGSEALITLLKHTAPGFLYSVGMPPPMAAASLEALRIMEEEPERVQQLQANGKMMPDLAREAGRHRLCDRLNGSSGHYRKLAARGAPVARLVRAWHQRPANHLSCRRGADRAVTFLPVQRAYGRADTLSIAQVVDQRRSSRIRRCEP